MNDFAEKLKRQGQIPAPCRPGCVHEGIVSGIPICQYILNTDRMRPCPAGPDCTEWTDKGEYPVSATVQWDIDRAKELWEAGFDAVSIADMVGVKVGTLRFHASKKGWRRLRKAEPADTHTHTHTHTAEAAPSGPSERPEPEPDPEPKAAPAPIGPIELTIRTGGIKLATLSAPDGESALSLYRQLGACLTALGVDTALHSGE